MVRRRHMQTNNVSARPHPNPTPGQIRTFSVASSKQFKQPSDRAEASLRLEEAINGINKTQSKLAMLKEGVDPVTSASISKGNQIQLKRSLMKDWELYSEEARKLKAWMRTEYNKNCPILNPTNKDKIEKALMLLVELSEDIGEDMSDVEMSIVDDIKHMVGDRNARTTS